MNPAYISAFINFLDSFIRLGAYLIFAVLTLAGWAVLWYGRGRAHEQSRVANLIDRGIL